jgi:signal transduction histidine kinase
MPTTQRHFPTHPFYDTDTFAASERDPHFRITRALERTRTELESVLIDVKRATSAARRLELVDHALRLHFLGSRLGKRLTRLGDGGLLTLSAIREANVATVIRECALEIAPECRRRHIVLELRLDPLLPPTWIDTEQLAEAIRCLLDDAMAALPEQGTLFIEARNDGYGIAIMVHDDRPREGGLGLDAGELFVASRFADALDGDLERRALAGGTYVLTETILRIPEVRAVGLTAETAPPAAGSSKAA